jgi:hypothetical protein
MIKHERINIEQLVTDEFQDVSSVVRIYSRPMLMGYQFMLVLGETYSDTEMDELLKREYKLQEQFGRWVTAIFYYVPAETQIYNAYLIYVRKT